VIVFFVLSGFLVGGSVIKAHRQGQWRWTGYLSRRLSRLWIVIVPALLLTLFWDSIGLRGPGSAG
jgi:peptidoglycan/LPS O-acetylase OafA/YrhL